MTGRRGASAALRLRKPLARAIRGGHPWIFADALVVPPGTPPGVVEVADASGGFVARGLYDPDSAIGVRVWTTERGEALDADLVRQRVAAATAVRAAVIDRRATNAYRLLNGEGDRTPGLVCDLYGATAVLRLDSPTVTPLLDAVCDAVRSAAPDTRRILLRAPERAGGGHQPGGPGVTALVGSLPEGPVRVRENGVLLDVELVRGHKTGAYLDQRENRRLVGALAQGRRCFDGFAYTGGFALAAALGGARAIVAVDTAGPALEAAQRNFALNGLATDDGAWRFVTGDVLEALETRDEPYDLVVLDPPSMAPSAAARTGALKAYRRLNEAALRRLAPRGLLFTASCSSHITEADLLGVVREASVSARRGVRVLAALGAGPDHPWLPAFPEGRYLTALLLAVDVV